MRLVGGLLVVLVVQALVPAAPGPRSVDLDRVAFTSDRDRAERPAKGRRIPLGVSPGAGILDLPPARLRADLRAMRRLGADRVRVDLSWARVAHVPTRLDWSATDRVIRAARAEGLRVMLVVGYRPWWIGTNDAPAYGRFVTLAARRYAGLVFAWELWNEPNLSPAWQGNPNPEAYARLVAAAGAGIRARAPRARIVIGALAPALDAPDGSQISPMTFLSRFYATGIDRRLFDAVSVHPYSYPALPGDREWWNTFHRLPDLHGVMRRAGDGRKRLWLTEYGAPTGASDRSVRPTTQARMVVDAYRRAAQRRFVASMWVYSLRDTDTPSTRDPEAAFGLLDHRGRPKPAFTALRRELRRS